MNAQAKLRMSADEFIAWATDRPDGKRYELAAGEVVAMSPERVGHTRVKHRVWLALRTAIAEAKLDCEAVGDGSALRTDESTVYEPDAVVHCGPSLADDAVEVRDPVIVVEVVSPSSRGLDTGAKLHAYFRLPSVQHYLVVDGWRTTVVHHCRTGEGRIETRIVRSGDLVLDPPGLTISTARFFSDLP